MLTAARGENASETIGVVRKSTKKQQINGTLLPTVGPVLKIRGEIVAEDSSCVRASSKDSKDHVPAADVGSAGSEGYCPQTSFGGAPSSAPTLWRGLAGSAPNVVTRGYSTPGLPRPPFFGILPSPMLGLGHHHQTGFATPMTAAAYPPHGGVATPVYGAPLSNVGGYHYQQMPAGVGAPAPPSVYQQQPSYASGTPAHPSQQPAPPSML